MDRQGEFRTLLREELLRRCRKNPTYSARAFARSLGVDAPTLNKIIRGKRPTGRITIERLGTRLGMGPDELAPYLTKPGRRKEPARSPSPDPYGQLAVDSFRIISDWHHYAILELLRLDHFRPDPAWVSKTLGIGVHEVRDAVERLSRVGLLEIREDGSWNDLSGGRSTTLGHGFSNSAFRNLQRQVLEKALDALDETPMEERDQTSMTFAADRELLPEARRRITRFRRSLARFLSREGQKRDAVYHLGISLYPVTRFEGEKS